MKNLFMNSSLNLITKYNHNYNDEEIEKLKYGLEGIYLTITKTIIIIALAIMFKILKETISILILYNIIRYFAFGFHAEKSIECLIMSSILFIGLPLLMFYLKPLFITKLLISIMCTTTIAIFAPADTIKRPLPNKKKRKIRKICSTIIAIIYSVICIIASKKISEIFLCTLIIQAIIVNPITYMIFKQPFNNYKTYIPD